MVFFAPKIALVEIHISCLSDWMWWGMRYEPADFTESAPVELPDGTQIEFCRYKTADERAACIFVKPPQLHRAIDRYFNQTADKLSRFLSFATDQHVETTSIHGYAEDVRALDRSVWPDPIVLYENTVEDPTLRYVVPIPRYYDVRNQLAKLVQRWFDMYDDWKYAVELYFIGKREQRIGWEPHLVLATMALEALYKARGDRGEKSFARLNRLVEPFAGHFGSKQAKDNALDSAQRVAQRLRTRRDETCV